VINFSILFFILISNVIKHDNKNVINKIKYRESRETINAMTLFLLFFLLIFVVEEEEEEEKTNSYFKFRTIKIF
jgi:F0F1-type ATP synthase membrane subunit a